MFAEQASAYRSVDKRVPRGLYDPQGSNGRGCETLSVIRSNALDLIGLDCVVVSGGSASEPPEISSPHRYLSVIDWC